MGKMKEYGYGGMSKEPLKKKKAGGSLDPIPAGNKGLPMLSKEVRNQMGYKKTGGAALESSMNGYVMKHGGSCGKRIKGKMLRR